MIVIVVRGGVVQEVYSDEPQEDVAVVDFDNAEDPESQATPEQLESELVRVAKEMHLVY